MSQRDTRIHLRWDGDERFTGESGSLPITLDGSGDALSPMQALAAGLAGCMSIDVASILEKGRQPVESMEITLTGERADQPPRRFVSFQIHYRISGKVDPKKVERAIALSKETYCSVWHTLRQDIPFDTSFEVA